MVILRIQYTAHVFLLGFVTLLPHNDSAEKLAKGDMQTNMDHLQETKFAPVAWNDEQKNKSKTGSLMLCQQYKQDNKCFL